MSSLFIISPTTAKGAGSIYFKELMLAHMEYDYFGASSRPKCRMEQLLSCP